MFFSIGVIYFRVKHELPKQMLQKLHDTLTAEDIENLGGESVESAYKLMVDVLTSHLLWTLDHIESSHASKYN